MGAWGWLVAVLLCTLVLGDDVMPYLIQYSHQADRWLDTSAQATNGVVVQLSASSGSATQQWEFNPIQNQLNAFSTNYCMDGVTAALTSGQQLRLMQCHGGAEQQWQILGNKIKFKQQNQCLEHPGGTAPMETRTCATGLSTLQGFSFIVNDVVGLGCWTDSTTARDLPFNLGLAVVSLNACAAAASRGGYTYFGVQAGVECWGGDSFGSLGASSSCTRGCNSDPWQLCGGDLANFVYRTPVCATYCKACRSTTQCVECNPGFALENQVCVTCGAGSYVASPSSPCQACSTNCRTCSSAAVCLDCDAGFALENQECVDCATRAQTVFEATDKECKPCGADCASCDLSGCKLCARGWALDAGNCVTCGQGTYVSSPVGACTPCPARCVDCVAGVCTKCASDYALTTADPWLKLLRQRATFWFTAEEWDFPGTGEEGDKYAILSQLTDQYRLSDGKFEFKLYWPDLSTPNMQLYNHWKQTTNPVTMPACNSQDCVQGYEPVTVVTQHSIGAAPWRGVEKGSASSSKPTLLDGDVSHGNWWMAIGSTRYHGQLNKFPGPCLLWTHCQLTGLAEFFVKTVDNQCTTCPVGYYVLNNDEPCRQCKANCDSCTHSADCQACSPGYSLEDDECALCDAGFRFVSTTTPCEDIDACVDYPCHNCVDLAGLPNQEQGRTCNCDQDYFGTGEFGECVQVSMIADSLAVVEGAVTQQDQYLVNSTGGGQLLSVDILLTGDAQPFPANMVFNILQMGFKSVSYPGVVLPAGIPHTTTVNKYGLHTIVFTVPPGFGNNISVSLDFCAGKWTKAALVYADIDCPLLDVVSGSEEECRDLCLGTPSCTALNTNNATSTCELRACTTNTRSPSLVRVDWTAAYYSSKDGCGSTDDVVNEWRLFFRQTMPYRWPRDVWREVTDGVRGNQYSILDKWNDNYRRAVDGKFEIKMVYSHTPTAKYQHWVQTTNPRLMNTTAGDRVEGYAGISLTQSTNDWGGLEKSTNALLDGSVDSGTWWYAIGAYVYYPEGELTFPGAGWPVTQAEVYLKIPEAFAEPAPLFSYPAFSLANGTLFRFNELSTGGLVLEAANSFSEKIQFSGVNLVPVASLTKVYFGPHDDLLRFNCAIDEAASRTDLMVCLTEDGGYGTVLFFTVVTLDQARTSTDVFNYPAIPRIQSVAGCPQNTSTPEGWGTSRCPTTGGLPITLYGVDFATPVAVLVAGVACGSVTLFDNNKITCSLRPGAGSNLPLVVSSAGFLSPAKTLLSYEPPLIMGLAGGRGCVPVNGSIGLQDCDREGGGVRLTIFGSNFGSSQAIVALGLTLCSAVVHEGAFHDTLTCQLPPGNRLFNPMSVVVFRGDTSPPVTISYQQCAAGFQQNPNNISGCLRCPPGYISDTGDQQCTACEAGRFSGSNNLVCDKCPAGRNQPSYGADSCVPCQPGWYSPTDGAPLCLACPPGSFTSKNNSVQCEMCASGHHQPQSGSPQCLPCQPGTYDDRGGRAECLDCPAGRYGNGTGNTECNPCQTGYAQPEQRQQQCLECVNGTYTDTLGAPQCIPCSPGTASPKNGSSVCDRCAKGKAQRLQGKNKCESCGPGTYSQDLGAVACKACPPGTAANYSAVGCARCTAGRSALGGSGECAQCLVGRASSADAQTECAACQAGSYAASLGSRQCELCAPGQFQDRAGQLQCANCSLGSFTASQGQLACAPCVAGRFTNIVGSRECQTCPDGYFSLEGAVVCEACPVGTTTSSEKRSCDLCRPGLVALTDGSGVCHPCPGEDLVPSETVACICKAGLYAINTSAGVDTCRSCPPGTECGAPGVLLEELSTKPGWWRGDEFPEKVMRCIQTKHCPGGAAGSCRAHHTGPMCMLCQPGFEAARQGALCEACAGTKGLSIGLSILLIVLGICVLFAMYVFVLYAARHRTAEVRARIAKKAGASGDDSVVTTDSYSKQHSSQHSAELDTSVGRGKNIKLDKYHGTDQHSMPSLMPKFKVFIGFVQVAGALVNMGRLPWPSGFTAFASAFEVLSLDIIPWQSLACATDSINYLAKALVSALIPVGLLLALTLGYYVPMLVANRCDMSDTQKHRIARRIARLKFTRVVTFTAFLLYPLVCNTVLSVYNCVDINGTLFLAKDFTILCDSETWRTYALGMIPFVLLYPIGVPLAFWAILRNSSINERLNLPSTQLALGFLYESFSSARWYFELLDVGFKLSLTSLVFFVPQDAQMMVASGCCCVFIAALLLLMPYTRPSDGTLHILAVAELIILAQYGIVVAAELPDVDVLPVVSDVLLSIVLIALVVVLMLVFFLTGVKQLWQFRKTSRRNKLVAQSQIENSNTGLADSFGDQSVILE